MSSGGGKGGPTSTTVYQNAIPEQLMPYASQLMGQSQALTQFNPYQAYTQQQVAGYNPLQEAAYQSIYQLQTPPELQQAMGMTGLAGLAARSTEPYEARQFYPNFSAEDAEISPMQYTQARMENYMSPYMEDVVQRQRLGAIEDYAESLPQLASVTTQVGGLGGTRQALLQSQKTRELRDRLADIRAQGYQGAFTNAQQMFEAQRQARMQADLANQQAAMREAEFRMQAQQAREQSRQFGAGLGLQGIQAQLQAAGQLGGLAGQQFQQQQAITQALMQAGQQLQTPEQKALEAEYKNFMQAQQYPYQQLAFMSDILRGVPTYQSVASTYGGGGNTLGQIAGLGMGLGSLVG
jgi:hypothetical protein